MLYHALVKTNTTLYGKRSVGCKMYGLILLFCSAIAKALILATATEDLEDSSGDNEKARKGAAQGKSN